MWGHIRTAESLVDEARRPSAARASAHARVRPQSSSGARQSYDALRQTYGDQPFLQRIRTPGAAQAEKWIKQNFEERLQLLDSLPRPEEDEKGRFFKPRRTTVGISRSRPGTAGTSRQSLEISTLESALVRTTPARSQVPRSTIACGTLHPRDLSATAPELSRTTSTLESTGRRATILPQGLERVQSDGPVTGSRRDSGGDDAKVRCARNRGSWIPGGSIVWRPGTLSESADHIMDSRGQTKGELRRAAKKNINDRIFTNPGAALEFDRNYQKELYKQWEDEWKGEQAVRVAALKCLQVRRFFDFLEDTGVQDESFTAKKYIREELHDVVAMEQEIKCGAPDLDFTREFDLSLGRKPRIKQVLEAYAELSMPAALESEVIFRPTFCRFIIDTGLVSQDPSEKEKHTRYHHAVRLFDKVARPDPGAPWSSRSATIEQAITVVSIVLGRQELPASMVWDHFEIGLDRAEEIAKALLGEASHEGVRSESKAKGPIDETASRRKQMFIETHGAPPRSFDGSMSVWTHGIRDWAEITNRFLTPKFNRDHHAAASALGHYLRDMVVEPDCLYIGVKFRDFFLSIYDAYCDEQRSRKFEQDDQVWTEVLPHMTYAAFFRFCMDFSVFPSLCSFEAAYSAYREADCVQVFPESEVTPSAEKLRGLSAKIDSAGRFALIWVGQCVHAESEGEEEEDSDVPEAAPQQMAKLDAVPQPEDRSHAQPRLSAASVEVDEHLARRHAAAAHPVAEHTPSAANVVRRASRDLHNSFSGEWRASHELHYGHAGSIESHDRCQDKHHSKPHSEIAPAGSSHEPGTTPSLQESTKARQATRGGTSLKPELDEKTIQEEKSSDMSLGEESDPEETARVRVATDFSWIEKRLANMSEHEVKAYMVMSALADGNHDRFADVASLLVATGEVKGKLSLIDAPAALRAFDRLHIAHGFEGAAEMQQFIKTVDPQSTQSNDMMDIWTLEKGVGRVAENRKRRWPSIFGDNAVHVAAKAALGEEARRLDKELEPNIVFGPNAFLESILFLGLQHLHAVSKGNAPSGVMALWLIAFLQWRIDEVASGPKARPIDQSADDCDLTNLPQVNDRLPRTRRSTVGTDAACRSVLELLGTRSLASDIAKDDGPATPSAAGSVEIQVEEKSEKQSRVPEEPLPVGIRYRSFLEQLVAKRQQDGKLARPSSSQASSAPSKSANVKCVNCGRHRGFNGLGSIFCHVCSGIDDRPLRDLGLFPAVQRRRFCLRHNMSLTLDRPTSAQQKDTDGSKNESRLSSLAPVREDSDVDDEDGAND